MKDFGFTASFQRKAAAMQSGKFHRGAFPEKFFNLE
jgi:hypothetical protein